MRAIMLSSRGTKVADRIACNDWGTNMRGRLVQSIALSMLLLGQNLSHSASYASQPPQLSQEQHALVEAFLAAANGGDLAQDAFISEHVERSPRMPRSEMIEGLKAISSSGGLRLISATARSAGIRLVVATPGGRTGRVDLVASDSEPGKLTALPSIATPAPYPGPMPQAALPRAELIAAIDRRVRFAAERDDFSGTVLVMNGGDILYSASFGQADRERHIPNSPRTRFNLGSMDKQFTAVAIGQLIDRGLLTLDTRLIDVLPDYPNRSAAEKITIRHLLSHRAGLGMLFDRPGWDWKLSYERMDQLLPLFAATDPRFEPGSRFAYSNEGFVVLGAVVERLSGRSWYDYVRENIFERSGMLQTAYLTDDPTTPNRAVGYRFAAGDPLGLAARVPNWDTLSRRGNSCGGSFSTAGDMVRFLQALHAGKLLAPSTLAALLENGAVRRDGYALGFEREELRPGRTLIGHDGGGPASGVNSDAKIIWETGFSYAVLGNYDAPFAQALGRDIAEILAAQ